MIKLIFSVLILVINSDYARSQDLNSIADSIRLEYNIPELGYAVVSADTVFEINCLGIKRAGSKIAAEPNDRFHLGSNTKAITGLIAALLVKENKLSWDTKFFDLSPELKPNSNSAYYNMTLLDLLGHRAKIQPLTDGEEFPNPQVCTFKGDASSQRYQFVEWVLTLDPVETEESVSYSNAGYSAAAVMLEKASGKSWEDLVLGLGNRIGLNFGFSWPNICDASQPWGHWYVENKLIPTPPTDSYRLCWVEPAGDINMSITDYTKFVQLQLQGLQGKSSLLSKEEFEYMHYGLPESDHYSIGWTWAINKNNHHVSAHNGSADTFYCFAYIIKEIDKAYVVLANCGSEQADNGVRQMLLALMKKYGT